VERTGALQGQNDPPPICHYDLHLRDRLCDVARGTPLVAMHVLQGWQRVDQTIKPTVPHGIVKGLLDASLLDKERRQGPSKVPHSKLSAQRWAEDTWGHAAPVDISKRGDIQTALKNTLAMVQGQAKTSSADLVRVRAATGLLPTRAALDSLAAKLAQRQQLDATLEQQGHAQLQAQLQAPAASWQADTPWLDSRCRRSNLGYLGRFQKPSAGAAPAATAGVLSWASLGLTVAGAVTMTWVAGVTNTTAAEATATIFLVVCLTRRESGSERLERGPTLLCAQRKHTSALVEGQKEGCERWRRATYVGRIQSGRSRRWKRGRRRE